jgi:glutamine synthetase
MKMCRDHLPDFDSWPLCKQVKLIGPLPSSESVESYPELDKAEELFSEYVKALSAMGVSVEELHEQVDFVLGRAA